MMGLLLGPKCRYGALQVHFFSMERLMLAIVAVLALAGLVLIVVGSRSKAPPEVVVPTVSAEASAVSTLDTDRRNDVSKLDVSSPEATVETQLELLRRGEDDAFATTFLPGVVVTEEAIAACKKRIASVAVQPDWDMAEDRVVDGQRVQRVGMFGKSMTGFHQIGTRWLADTVWCVPTGLP